MDGQSVLLRIESVLAFDVANFKDRKSNSGFGSVFFRMVNHVPVGDAIAMPTDSHWFRRKVF
jgi:hypothetical protein